MSSENGVKHNWQNYYYYLTAWATMSLSRTYLCRRTETVYFIVAIVLAAYRISNLLRLSVIIYFESGRFWAASWITMTTHHFSI